MKQDHQGKLVIITGNAGLNEGEVRALLDDGFRISSCGVAMADHVSDRELTCELRWRARQDEKKLPESIYRLAARAGVVRFVWTPQVR